MSRGVQELETKRRKSHAVRRLALRVLLPAAACIVLMVAAVFLIILPSVRQALIDGRKETLREIAQPVFHALEELDAEVAAGKYSLAEAQAKAEEFVRSLRYGPGGLSYFWINDQRPFMVMHPYIPELDGTDVSTYADPEGKHLFVDFVSVIEANPEGRDGYVEYLWQWHDDPTRIAPKLSYVRLFEPWGWVVGTGMYIEDVRAQTAALTRHVSLIFVGLTVAIAVLTAYLVWQHLSTESLREQAELAQQESALGLQAVIDQTFQLIGLLQPDGTLLQANQTALDYVGKTHTEVSGQPFWDTPWWQRLPKEQRRIRNAVAKAAQGEFVRFETRFVGPDDAQIDVDFSLKPAYDGKRVVFLIAEGRDISERKQAEAEQDRLRDELRQAKKLEAIGRLAGGVAHDFNNLLTVIMGEAELLASHFPEESEAARSASHVAAAAQRAADLTRQLLSFARKGKYRTQPVDMHSLLRDVKQLLERSIDKRIEITLDLLAEQSTVLGDASELHSALLNLGINARDAMPDGGRLAFETRVVGLNEVDRRTSLAELKPGRYLQISVVDNGTGMNSETLERVFEPFFTTKRDHRGTGLGLAAVYGCVRSHGGSVCVASEVGRGTTFRVVLPVIAAAPSAAWEPDDSEPVRGTGHILLVDDEMPVREYVASLLMGLGYEVTACPDGVEALAVFEREHDQIDLVILDMVMPKLSGAEVFRAMKRIQPNVRALLLSGYTKEGAADALLSEGVLEFIHKPFHVGELSRVIARHIRTPERTLT